MNLHPGFWRKKLTGVVVEKEGKVSFSQLASV